MDSPLVIETVDGDGMPTEEARVLCKRSEALFLFKFEFGFFFFFRSKVQSSQNAVFYGGCALLPWLWFVNVWLFWPDFIKGNDAIVSKCKPVVKHRRGFKRKRLCLPLDYFWYWIPGLSVDCSWPDHPVVQIPGFQQLAFSAYPSFFFHGC